MTEKEKYAEYLKTPQWEKYRQVIFHIHGKRCNRCGSIHRLQVHHKRYIKGLKPWQYRNPDDLEVLCVFCHRKEHGIRPRAIREWNHAGDLALEIYASISQEKLNAD